MASSGSLNLGDWSAPEALLPSQISEAAPIDARGANWRGQVLGSLDLRQAKLCRVDLRGTDLRQCQLEDADLRLAIYDTDTKAPDGFDLRTSGAIGPGAKLNGAFLNNADLRGIDLRGGVLMGAYLSGTDLSGAQLDGVSLAGSDMRSAVLRGAMCRGTRFGTSELDMADLRGADLHDAGLDAVQSIKGADFSLCIGLDDQLSTLLTRPITELDCWNPLTRSTTRDSLESLRRPANNS